MFALLFQDISIERNSEKIDQYLAGTIAKRMHDELIF